MIGDIDPEMDDLSFWYVDDVDSDVAKRGSEVTFQVDSVIRASDKLYKVVPSEEVED